MPRKVEIVEYDDKWEKIFKEQAKKLSVAMGSNCRSVEHIGGTAIKGNHAEPTIDILCVVEDIARVDLQEVALHGIGYDPCGSKEVLGERLFCTPRDQVADPVKVAAFGREEATFPLCRLYVYDRRNTRDINRYRVVRDFLRGHPKDADDLMQVKIRLARQNEEDYEAYRESKKEYLDEVEANALEWQRQQDRMMSYMSVGMCIGTALGAIGGALIDRTGIGISYGISFGMLAGLAIGLL